MIPVINDIVDVSLCYKIPTVLGDNIFCASRPTVIQHIANEINSIHLVST